MRPFIAILILCATAAVAADHRMVWSSYSPELRLKSIDRKLDVVRFSGHITVRGELVIVFEGEGDDRDLLWVKLVPDAVELRRFPQVVGGFYPAPLKSLWIHNSDDLLEQAFGPKLAAEYSKGHDRYVSRRGTFVLADYSASVECDSREYGARLLRVAEPGDSALLANSER